MTPTFHESVRQNTEDRWDDELADRREPAIDRLRANPAKLDDSLFVLLYSAVLVWGPARTSPVASRVAPLIAPALAAKSAAPSKSIAELAVGNLANLLACCGYPDETGPVADWLYTATGTAASQRSPSTCAGSIAPSAPRSSTASASPRSSPPGAPLGEVAQWLHEQIRAG